MTISPIHRDKMFERFFYAIWITVGLSFIAMVFLSATFGVVTLGFAIFLIFPLCWFEFKRRHSFRAKALFLFCLYFLIWSSGVALRSELSEQCFLIPVALMGLLILGPTDLWGQVLIGAMTILTWLFMSLIRPSWVPDNWIVSLPEPRLAGLVNFFIAYGFVHFYLRVYMRANAEIFSASVELQEEYRRSLAWNNAMIDGAPFAIVSTLPGGTITTFNKTAEEMFGYSAAEVVGQETPELWLHPREGTGAGVAEHIYRRRDGSTFHARVRVAPVRDEDGEALGQIGISEDLSTETAMQRMIEEQRLKMINSARLSMLGELVSRIAHEINNPLSVVSGKAMLMAMAIEEGRANEQESLRDLKLIEKAVGRIGKIIRSLKMTARNGENDPMVFTCLGQIIEDSLEMSRMRARTLGISLDVVMADPMPVVECQPVQISQMLVNLINNAIDAVAELPEKWIRIEVLGKDDRVEISVTDSGLGISREVADKMMEPFFTTKQVGKGTGLGLSIAKSIAEKHQGSIFYDSRAQHTRFVIEIGAQLQKNRALEGPGEGSEVASTRF